MGTTARVVFEQSTSSTSRESIDDVWTTTQGRHVRVDVQADIDRVVDWAIGTSEKFCYVALTPTAAGLLTLQSSDASSKWVVSLAIAQKVVFIFMKPASGASLTLKSPVGITGVNLYFF